jgi:hypothetical protein
VGWLYSVLLKRSHTATRTLATALQSCIIMHISAPACALCSLAACHSYLCTIMLTLCCCTVSLCYCSSPNSETREYDDDYDDQYDDVQPSVTTGGSDALIDQVSRCLQLHLKQLHKCCNGCNY